MAEFEDYLAQINKKIVTITPREAMALPGDENICFVDLRDGLELVEFGMIKGAQHCPRGSLEFRIPQASKWHMPCFSQGLRFVLYCSHGERSVLGVDTALKMGLENVCHIKGGMIAWEKAGGQVVDMKKEQG